ncbi:hypothetical protein PAECIP112173_00361 [Paenibacillus sp. JJ-100]|uniref:hypothetical protein n=1 Tax=Paenibacillus sp. JJ-100 TaxID=2974896 RepID=UPI0022FF8C32|nr:hypothetical protein [Paenibacillus sp. JJ-100]CAI6023896.1 hypothetical protein PAECIP112173_00361 [Paenibacillus sp. JJ-100]
MTLNQYRELADKLGGEVGEQITALLDELEEARKIIRGKKYPPLLGSKEVAEQIGVDPKNMHHVRKNKLFPEPDVMVGNRPFWFKPTIDEYQERMEEWRGRDKPE